jgi:PhnB protein
MAYLGEASCKNSSQELKTFVMQLTPYLMFNGTCEEALNFYAGTIGGEIKNLSRYEGSPAESMGTDKQNVMHAVFEGNGIAFMASDGSSKESVGNLGNVHLCLDFNDANAMTNVFNALGEGGKITMPLQDTFWGAKFGMLTDKFGINWMFNSESK